MVCPFDLSLKCAFISSRAWQGIQPAMQIERENNGASTALSGHQMSGLDLGETRASVCSSTEFGAKIET
jgi:hypothetical protein